MINSTIAKLALSYLGIIMLLTIIFSTAFYQMYRVQMEGDLQRQPTGIVRNFFSTEGYIEFRQEQFERNVDRMRQNLVLLNTAMLVIGGVVSYLLARKTLQPIVDALESQSRFTADASHELRTPLAAMQAEIEVAMRDPNLSKAEVKDLLKSNLEEVAKLKKLSEGLLTLARSDKQDMSMNRVSLQRIVLKTVDRMIPVAKGKEIEIKHKLEKISVDGDKQRLESLVTILIDNAIKYSPEKTTINVRLRRHKKVAVLTVTDKGYGIKAVDLPHIFDRFYRSDTSRCKEKTSGYGLGLSIAKKIVETHDGSIEVKSSPGKGATFIVKLPIGV